MDGRKIKLFKRSAISFLLIIVMFLVPVCRDISVYAEEKEEDTFVIESVQAAMPKITAYIRNDYQIGASDIAASLDNHELVVENVDFFENKGEGITYYVLLDVSASFSESYFKALQNSLVTFRSTMSDKDRLVLITFGSSVNTVLLGDETGDEAEEKILSLTNGDSDTFFYEALLQAAEETDKNNLNRREVIMMISDGGDDHNAGKANADEAINALNRRNIPVYGYAAGASQNNMQSFVEVTDACGGTVTEFTSQETDKIFTNFTRMLKEMQVVTLIADSNVVSNKTETLRISILSDGTTAERDVLITEHIPDEIAPSIIAVRQTGEKELIINYSEPVSGADVATSYKVTCDDVVLDVMTAEYDSLDNSAVIGFNNELLPGKYVIEVSSVTDNSMEKNPLTGSFEKIISSAEDGESEASTQDTQEYTEQTSGEETSVSEETVTSGEASGSEGNKSFWESQGLFVIIGGLIVVLIFAAFMVYNVVSKKNIAKRMEEERRRQAESRSSYTKSGMKQGEQRTQPKVVQLKQGAGRRLVFEILNVEAGENSRFEAELTKSMIVGRADICDVVIKDKRISRQHFALEEKSGAIYIRDLQTTNGTGVNGALLKGVKQLNNNDIISAGSVKIRIRW